MPLDFDDLVPNAPSAGPKGGLSFDDLVPLPAKKAEVSTFGDVVKQGAAGLAEGALSLPANIYHDVKGIITGQKQPTGVSVAGPAQTTAGKFARSAGEAVGNPLSYIGPGGPLAKGAAAAAGGLGAEAGGQLTNDSTLGRVAGGALGGMAPAAAARGVGRAVTLAPMKPDQARLVQTLRDAGIEPTAGQASGNRALKYAESRMGEQLGAGGATEAANERVSKEFNQWAFKQAGETADRATPDVMARMWERLGNRFDELTARNTLQADVPMLNKLQTAFVRYQTEVQPSLQVKAVENIMNDIANALTKSGGVIPGDIYQSTRSQLGRLARGAPKDNPELRQIYREMTDSFDDAMERTLAARKSPDLGAFKEVRNQYHNAMLIDKAIGVGAKGEEITPNKLRNAMQREDSKGFHAGRGDMGPVAHAADQVLAPLPDSGTAARAAFSSPLKVAGQLPMGLAGKVLHSKWAQDRLKDQQAAAYLRNLGKAHYPTLAARGGLVAGQRPSPQQQYLES